MNEHILFKYMDRLKVNPDIMKEEGPVITITREYGCYAGEISEKLVERLRQRNENVKNQKWNWISKEIVNDAAIKLQTNSHQLKHFFDGDTYKFFGNIIFSFSRPNASDDLIKKTVTKLVKSYAEDGYVVIVGRAGGSIAKNIPKSLHIKLVAPISWRIQFVAKRYNISIAEASKRVKEIDRKRSVFLKEFGGDKPDSEFYHAVFNREKLTADEIVDQIMLLAQAKGLFEGM